MLGSDGGLKKYGSPSNTQHRHLEIKYITHFLIIANSCSDYLEIWSLSTGTGTVNGRLWASLNGLREINWSPSTEVSFPELHMEPCQRICTDGQIEGLRTSEEMLLD